MSKEIDPNGYRDRLSAELRRRRMTNPRYSLRAFAHAVGLSPGFLSKILNGERNLSASTAVTVGEKLGFSAAESAHFCELVQMENAPPPLRKILSSSQHEQDSAILSLDSFQVISDWY